MSKTISNKEKIATLISMIFFALFVTYVGLSVSFNGSLRFMDRITTQTILSLGPTITFASVVCIGIYTMDLLKTKQPITNNKTKRLHKKHETTTNNRRQKNIRSQRHQTRNRILSYWTMLQPISNINITK